VFFFFFFFCGKKIDLKKRRYSKLKSKKQNPYFIKKNHGRRPIKKPCIATSQFAERGCEETNAI